MAQSRDVAAQSLEDATVALLQSEPDLRDQVRKMLTTAVARFQHTLEYGSPDARMTLLKATVPGLVKAMGKVEQSSGEAAMREAYDRIRRGEAET